MPPKKKKSGKKKKKSKKSGKGKEPQMTMEEAILAYQMDVKSRSKEDLAYELRALKEKNERLKARNKRLKEEQLLHIKTLLKQAKEKDKEVEQTAEVGHEQVENALLGKFDTMKKEALSLQDFKELIKNKEKEIEGVTKEIKTRREYKNTGQHDHAKQIKILRQELQDMEDSHSDIAGHLERSLKIAKEEIETYTESTISKQKDIASEKAADSLNKGSRQDILDNRWLKKEVEIHGQGCEQLAFVVEELEKSNLEIMSELYDCKIEDLKITRKFYLACVNNEKSSDDEDQRGSDSEEEVYAEDGEVAAQEEKPEDYFDNYFLPGEDVFEDSPRLGPMELQLLSVTGAHKPIHRLYEPIEGADAVARGSQGEVVLPGNYGRPNEWPITNQMLHTLATQ